MKIKLIIASGSGSGVSTHRCPAGSLCGQIADGRYNVNGRDVESNYALNEGDTLTVFQFKEQTNG